MQQTISPASAITGAIVLPGDKSISHRYAMISAIAEGESRIHNYSTGADCHSTLGCMRALGIEIDGERHGSRGARQGARWPARSRRRSRRRQLRLHHPHAAAAFWPRSPSSRASSATRSLSRRPMQRIMRPLADMGARITAREDKFPPLEIHGAPAAAHRLRAARAQRAGQDLRALRRTLFAEGETTVTEPVALARPQRDRAARIRRRPDAWRSARSRLPDARDSTGRELIVPSDISSAAFFIVAALLVPGSQLTIRGVGLNPTRSALLDLLVGMGAKIRDPRRSKAPTAN